MKKRLLFITSLVLLLVLAACGNDDKDSVKDGNASNGNKAVEVEFWHAMSGPHEDFINKLVEDFNEDNENITVKPVNQGSYDDLEQKIMASAKAKTLPTISQAVPQVVPEYIANDFIEPLNQYIEDEDIGLTEEELNDYIEVFRDSSTWDDTFYSMPFSKSTPLLFYNKDILAEHDLDLPETWDELREVAETVTEDGVIGMGFENSFESDFQSLITQMGGTYIDEDKAEALFSSEEGIKAMQFIKDMVDDGIARTAGEDNYMSGPFSRGDVAMYIGSSPGIPHVVESAEGNIEWSTTTIPTYEGQAGVPFLGNDAVMFAQATDAEKEAGWKFLTYITSPEITADWAMNTGYLPVRYSAQELDAFQTYLEENPAHQASVEQFDAGFFVGRVKGSNAVRNIVLEELDNILLDRKTVEEGLQDAEDRANIELSK